ncbi:MAG: UvrD-helicase domain-containing protein [Desulfosarcina sp.]|nr:UvrD-helicase domain-containing protein [Desulfobacterales bacterium]
MTFLADLHVHSHFSRATAKNLDLEHLYMSAQRKGLAVVGTGDATHPGWFEAIRAKLVPAETGLFRLCDDLAGACDREIPGACRSQVRFILVSEISNIYKKDGRTRKNHNLVFLPSIDAAARFNRELDKIGNIKSDGRPILGLDAHDLLEIVLETDDSAFLVPAHIWTPWFSLLGSKSGFDSLEACFGDLTDHVFAVETGLSSDPPMNRLVSGLDRLTLISNSDAHSPAKLGREANIFHTELNYEAMRSALKSGHPDDFGGTLEFYPEEGKYHLDGHRKCGVRLAPDETRALGGVCPRCGKALTVGVLYRVQALADRSAHEIPDRFPPFESLIPMHDILSEVLQTGPASKKVGRAYDQLLEKHGSELEILRRRDPHDLDMAGPPLLGEAIRRMRSGKVRVSAGYDGEFGKIHLFDEAERRELMGQRHLFAVSPVDQPSGTPQRRRSRKTSPGAPTRRPDQNPVRLSAPPSVVRTNSRQQQAIACGPGPLMIVAGPGTGKTTTLTRRIAHLVLEQTVPADRILAITFTDKAALEMRERLDHLLVDRPSIPLATTFHSFCWQLLQEATDDRPPTVIGEEDRLFIITGIMRRMRTEGIKASLKPREMLARIEAAKQNLQSAAAFFESVALEAPTSQFAHGYRHYQDILTKEGWVDFDDLIFRMVLKLESDEACRQALQKRFRYVFIDEYQDLNRCQYRLVRALVPPDGNICVIGDPDQAIYGFRGSDTVYFNRFVEDFPDAQVIHLRRNYRSTETILEASWQVIRNRPNDPLPGMMGSRLVSDKQGVRTVAVLELVSEKAEAVAVGKIIEAQIGGTGFLSIDAGKVDTTSSAEDRSFGDFAVLFRTSQQADTIAGVFADAGIPFQQASRRKRLAQTGAAELLALYRLLHNTGTGRDFTAGARAVRPGLAAPLINAFLDWKERQDFSLCEAMENAAVLPVDGITGVQQRRLQDFLQGLAALKVKLKQKTPAENLAALDRCSAVRDLENLSSDYDDTLTHLLELAASCRADNDQFLARLALHRDEDTLRAGVEKVALLTMHAAKGLEFPVVFIMGCENGLVPFSRNKGDKADIEEERRLFYVAMTRARERLYLCWSRRRMIYGQKREQQRSPFVGEIEARLLAHQSPETVDKRRNRQVQLKLF